MSQRAIVIAGWPACGKSGLAGSLAARCGLVPIDREWFLTPMARPALRAVGEDPGDLTCEFFKSELSPAAYEALERLGREILQSSGLSVALAAPYGRQAADPRWLPDLQTRLGRPVSLIWMTAPLAVIRSRRGLRGAPRDLAALREWKLESSHIDPELIPAGEHLWLDSSKLTPDQVLTAASEWILDRSAPRL